MYKFELALRMLLEKYNIYAILQGSLLLHDTVIIFPNNPPFLQTYYLPEVNMNANWAGETVMR